MQVIIAHCSLAPEPLPQIAGLPAAVADLCRRCLARAPQERPSADEAARLLCGPPSRSRHRVHSMLGRAGAGAAGGLVATALMLANCAGGGTEPRKDGQAGAAGTGRMAAVSEPRAGCAVEYAVTEQARSTFTAELTVTNTGAAPVADWRLGFHLPGEQVLGRLSPGTWSQDGGEVVLRDAARPELPPGGMVRMSLSGQYTSSNPMPTGFALNEVACQQTLVASAPPPETASPAGPDNPASPDHKGKSHKGGDGRD
jgi:eukaryotic-like serine/threonine-protein kinase